jgi:hypothetical protein
MTTKPQRPVTSKGFADMILTTPCIGRQGKPQYDRVRAATIREADEDEAMDYAVAKEAVSRESER